MKSNIVIIGGAGHLGQAFVRGCKDKGYNVSVIDICDKTYWNKLKISVASFYKSDINDPVGLQKILDRIALESGMIDAVINSSYPRTKSYGKGSLEVTLKDFNQNIALHIGGYFNVMQIFIKYFLKIGKGNIINISSIQGVSSPKFEHYINTNMTSSIEYTTSKTAIIAMSKYWAKYLKGKNIRVNCISPGGILANQPKSFLNAYKISCINKGMLDERDLVGALTFLLSDSSKFINGQNIIVDDGWSL